MPYRAPLRAFRLTAFILIPFTYLSLALYGAFDSPSATPVPNVIWGFADSVAACPAGDSLVGLSGAQRPSKLRVVVFYSDAQGSPRVGVPAESIWVTIGPNTGTLVVNDAAARIYADSPTDSLGRARITLSSFSGSGSI